MLRRFKIKSHLLFREQSWFSFSNQLLLPVLFQLLWQSENGENMCRFHLKLACDYSVRDHGLIRISLLRHMNSISLQILNSLVKTHHIFSAIISIKITQLYTGKNLLRASLESLGFWSILSQLVQLGKESGQKSSFKQLIFHII